ncbi:hypothetical protein ACFVRR_06340 [Gottfriedia sp. NPDC057948]|uniref:hypothetical protein n=1 Tax=Gottfriedia sp. NPDC057948 TaxID=3346287 RepID=UPI0036D9E667
MKIYKRVQSTLLTSALTIGLGVTSFGVANAVDYGSYVDVYKQFNVGTYGGTYNNTKTFSGGGGSGNLSKKDTIIVDSYGAKKLSNVKITTSVSAGNPYYVSLYAEGKKGSAVRYSFKDKMLRTNKSVNWTPSSPIGNIMSSTCYIMTDATGAGGDQGKQYRYVSIFKY